MISAWENGLDGSLIPDMTPAEAHGYFVSKAARQRQTMANFDTLAWLIGSYTGIGVNAPKRYPQKPRNTERIQHYQERRREMTDDEMDAWARAFAERNGVVNDGNDGRAA